MNKPWHVTPDDERAQWALLPHVSVGPLRFRMSPDEVVATIGERPSYITGNRQHGVGTEQYRNQALTLYYRAGEYESELFGIKPDALRGPQVCFEGRALVAQVPSEVEDWIGQRAERMPTNKEMFYMPGGECGSFSLGLVVCLQRAGDRLVTRPIFLPADANDMYHQLPSEAWRI